MLQKVVEEKLKPSEPDRVAYIGLHDYDKKGSWINIFFDPLEDAEYVKWKPVESATNYGGQKCGAIDSNGFLISLPCYSKRAFICKKDLIPNSKYN